MALIAKALVTVEELLEYLQATKSTYQVAFLRLYNSSGDASAATVTKSGNTLTLIVTGGANAGTENIDLTAADADTATELVDKINGLSKGWVANLEGRSALTSTDLTNLPATGALLVANEQTLYGFNRLFLEEIINGVSSWLQETYLRRTLIETDYSTTPEVYDGDGGKYIFLKQYPIKNWTKIEAYDPYSDTVDDMTENDDYLRYDDDGILYHVGGGWTKGKKNYRVYYKGGLSSIPDDVKMAVNMICAQRINLARDGGEGLKSQKIGDYAVGYGGSNDSWGGDAGMPPVAADILFTYKRLLVDED
jgi:hypothetical protein